MVYIPGNLKESLKKGECVLFVGAGLSKGLPTWKELVKPLADELGISMDNDFRKIASWYELQFGRPELEEKIVSTLKKDVPLTETHKILAEIPLKAIITTNYDHVLEKALSKRNYVTIVHGREAPLGGADQLPLIKMHGDLDNPSTIVITKKDYNEYPENHRALITYILGLLVSYNFLFVGFSLEDPNFDTIYAQVTSLFGKSMRKSYAIFENPPPLEVERLEKESNIEVISVGSYDEVPDIFEELRSVCTERTRIKPKLTFHERENVQNRFCEVVERQNKWLDPRGIFQFDKMLTKREVALEDVYVVPRLVQQEPIQKRKKEKPEKGTDPIEREKRTKIEMEDIKEYTFEKQIELTIKQALSTAGNNHIVVLGDPGVGKTCLLRYIALKASTNKESLGIKNVLPVIIPLREYPQFGHDKLFKEFVFYYITNQIISLPKEVLEYFLDNNSFFFLLDGLDEVVSESERIHISRQVEQFMAQYPHTRMIMTSRPAGYRAAALIGAVPHFTLAAFNNDEITEFLVNWFRFLEKIEEEFEEGKAEEMANNLIDIILKKERILHLARNPLLLTILVLIHRVGKKLPERRAEFYEYSVKTVAGTWQTWKNLYSERKIPDQDIILAILENIGFLLHHKKQENIVGIEELRGWLKKGMEEECGHASREEINDFIWMLKERAGLLIERGFELYGFVHLTFQEYFAARYIALGRGTGLAQDLIKKNLYSSRWKEVFLLAAAVAPPQQANPIFDSILQAKNDFEEYIHSNLIFAGEALGDQPRIDDSKRKNIINRLILLTGPDNIDILRIEVLKTLMKVRNVFQFEDAWALELLEDKNSDVRWLAVNYFTGVGVKDSETKNKFFELLKDEDSDVRWQAVNYFTGVGVKDAETKNKIFELLKDKDSYVRWQAVNYFTGVGVKDSETKNKIFELLKDKDSYVHWQAVNYFTGVGVKDSETKNKFFELLKDKNSDVRWQAVNYFTGVGVKDSETKNKIFELLKDEDSDVRWQAVNYFTGVGVKDSEMKNKFFELLKDKDSYVRGLAVNYFTGVGVKDSETKNKIFELLKDKDSYVRRQAVKYFTAVGAKDAETKNKIFELLKDEDSYVRWQAVKYFTAVGAKDAETKNKFFELLEDESYSIGSAKTIQDIAVEYLLKYAREESSEKAPKLFKTKDEPTQRGAYKLMKALLITE